MTHTHAQTNPGPITVSKYGIKLLGLLLRFRQTNIAIIGDIRKVYHSIDIMLKDQMPHLFLWRDMMTPDAYAITVVNLGDKPSAPIALTALRKTADMGENLD